MKTWRFFWELTRFRPWLFWVNCTAITVLFVTAMVPGLVARDFFNKLAAGSKDVGLLWLVALLVMSALGRIVCVVVCQLTNVPFMLNGAALMQKNLFRRILAAWATSTNRVATMGCHSSMSISPTTLVSAKFSAISVSTCAPTAAWRLSAPAVRAKARWFASRCASGTRRAAPFV